MIAPHPEVADILIDHSLLDVEAVVDGDFVATDASRRNRNTRVTRRDGTGFFVKQVRVLDPQATESLLREARVYWLAYNDADFAELRVLVPRYLGYDDARRALVMELLPDVTTLAGLIQRGMALESAVLAELGSALARCHGKVGKRMLAAGATSIFPRAVPWILSVHHMDSTRLSPPSGGCAQVIQLLHAGPDFHRALDLTREQWRVDAFIHGDIKWDNFALEPAGQTRGLRILDWELADFGDAAWDVGAILQAFVAQWVSMIPQDSLPAEQIARWAPMYMQPFLASLGAFWNAYTRTMGLDTPGVLSLLESATRYAGARLVLAAYEIMYASPHITPGARHLMTAGLHLMATPKEAAGSWFPLV